MAYNTYGKLCEFDFNSTEQGWTEYCEQMEYYFSANSITDSKQKKAILLASVGNDTFKLIRNLFGQEELKAETTTLENINKRVKDHLSPKPNYIFARSDFFDCVRKPGQSVAEFLVELRKLSEHCQFTNLNEMLRDKFVNGLKDVQTQRRFFEIKEEKLTLEKAEQIALAVEKANLNARSLNPEQTQPQGTVHVVDPVGEVLKFERGRNSPSRVKEAHRKNNSSSKKLDCSRCGGPHFARDCKRKQYLTCDRCGFRGHTSGKCFSKLFKNIEVEPKDTADQEASSEEDCYTVFSTQEGPKTGAPYMVELLCQGKPIKMEVDTGASCTVMSRKEFDNLQKTTGNKIKLKPNCKPVRTYTKEAIKTKGAFLGQFKYKGQVAMNNVLVVDHEGPTLLGRDLLSKLKLDWADIMESCQVHAMQCKLNNNPNPVSDFPKLFEPGLGKLEGVKAKIHVKEGTVPIYQKARPIPFTEKELVDAELGRLENLGVIEPVQFSEWASQIVPVQKANGNIRLCGNYKTTVNKVSHLDRHPLPRVGDMFAALSGGTVFSKLDMSEAYAQVELDEASRKYTTINTHRGLFQYRRIPYGIKSAPSIFQRSIDSILAGIPNVLVFLDDILVTGKTTAEHKQNLYEVLNNNNNNNQLYFTRVNT